MCITRFKFHIDSFLKNLNIDPIAATMAFQELYDGKVHVGITSIRISPKEIYAKTQASSAYQVTETAPATHFFPDFNDNEERTYSIFCFSSHCRRINLVKYTTRLGMPGNLISVHVIDEGREITPLFVLVPHPKNITWAVTFDMKIYEATQEPIRGQMCAALSFNFAQVIKDPKLN